MKLKISTSILILLCLTSIVYADVVISEVMANEPGNRVMLEWVEIYNNEPFLECINQYHLVVGDDTLAIPLIDCLDGHSYAVLCRRLLPSIDNSDCFEYHWGDSSGVWGDAPGESYLATTVLMSLPNSSGHIYLLDSTSQVVDQFDWQSACTDGHSYERDDERVPSTSWHCNTTASGSTPGTYNSEPSVNPENYFRLVNDYTQFKGGFEIDYWFPEGTLVTIQIFDDTGRKRHTLVENNDRFQARLLWHAIDDDGVYIPPGLYFLRLNTTGAVNYSKIIPLVITP